MPDAKRRQVKSKKYVKVQIKKSKSKGKKYDAVFTRADGGTKTVSFGATGYSDYTMHKDAARKSRYMSRHAKREHWNEPDTAGSLSRWVLWNKPSFQASVADYKRKFNLK